MTDTAQQATRQITMLPAANGASGPGRIPEVRVGGGPPAEPDSAREEPKTKEEQALAREPDFVQRLLRKANDPEPAAEVAIFHGNDPEPVIKFHINPLTESEIRQDYNAATKWRPASRETGWQRVPRETDEAMFKGLVIYRATTPEDKKRYWENPELLRAYGVVSAWELIHKILRPGGVLQAFNYINEINGFKDEGEIEELLPNSSGPAE